MAYLYICEACQIPDHVNCEANTPLPEGDPENEGIQFGVGICICPCRKGMYPDVPAFTDTSEAMRWASEHKEIYEDQSDD
jgi:hypothetical protein